jgi:SAM-dependent methyltransferase
VVCGDALQLPFADHSIDIVMCSQVLHHFEGADALELLREMNRVARIRVIVSDLRRSWIAAAGLWLASFPLRFHAISRHDGVVSVMRGFTPEELVDTVRDAVGRKTAVHRRRAFRVTTSWTPVDR